MSNDIRKHMDLITEAFDRPYRGQWPEIMTAGSILLSGGTSQGSAGSCDRRRYEISDKAIYDATKSFDKSKLGDVDLVISDNDDIVGLIDIKLVKDKRRAGTGSEIIRQLVATSPADFVIYDIKTSAVAFWRKMGTTFFTRTGAPLTSVKGCKFVLGVIRKSGGNTPLIELPGYFPPPK